MKTKLWFFISGDDETADSDRKPLEHQIKFRDVISISARERLGIEKLKARIREIIDEEAEREEEDDEGGQDAGWEW